MRPGGGKQKGAAFERQVCKRLSLWITHGRSEDVFWRSAMSGGRATVHARTRSTGISRQAGDITATAPEGHKLTDRFYIECKTYRSLDLLPFLLGHDKGKLLSFWDTAWKEAISHSKSALLIAKQDRESAVVVMRTFDTDAVSEDVQPVALCRKMELAVFWFEDLFPLPKPKLRKRS